MAEQFVKQHIVPKRYLDRFTFEKDGKPVIGVRLTTKDKPKFFTSPTEKVGYIKNFYDVTDRDDPKYWEHYLAREFDTLCGAPLENIIANITLLFPKYRLTVSDKKTLSRIIISQLFRTPQCLERIYKIADESIGPFKKAYLSTFTKYERKQIEGVVNNILVPNQWKKEKLFNGVFSEENFAEVSEFLENNIWVVLYNTISESMPFVTSDNPVLLTEKNNKETGVFNVKFNSPTACLYFPLTPKIMIMNCNSDSALFFPLQIDDGKVTTIDDMRFICDVNTKIINQCFRHSFIPEKLFKELYDKKH